MRALNFILILTASLANGASRRFPLLGLPHFITDKEEQAISVAIYAWKVALIQQGKNPNKFGFKVVHRSVCQDFCSKRFCPYSQASLGSHIFQGDPKAACLGTRRSKSDTKEHFIQAHTLSDDQDMW